MGSKSEKWHVMEPGEKPLEGAGEKELDAAVKGLTPEGKKWQQLASGENPLGDATETDIKVAVEGIEAGKRHVEGAEGLLADATDADIEAAAERLGAAANRETKLREEVGEKLKELDMENPLEKLAAKMDQEKAAGGKPAKKANRPAGERPEAQA